MRTSSVKAEVISEMVAMYEAEESLRNIGNKFGVNPQTVRRLVFRAGGVIRPRGRPRKTTTPVAITPTVTEDCAPTTDTATVTPEQLRVVSF